MRDKLSYESEVLDAIHAKANTQKNQCFFVGFLDGVLANKRIDETELEPLLAECEAICRQVHDEDAAEIIAEANAGHENTSEELLNLLTLIAEVRVQYIDKTCRRSAANRLLGFCAGVNCDGIITTNEAKALLQRLEKEHDLEADPRIEALRHRLVDALEDGNIDPVESTEIGQLISCLVGDSYSDTGIASSDAVPVIQDLDLVDRSLFEGRSVVVTGKFKFGSRSEVEKRLNDIGARCAKVPSKGTDFVILGSEGSPHVTYKHHGGKLAKALEMRAAGQAPRIYLESQLREIFEPM